MSAHTPRPTAAWVRSLKAGALSWGSYKHSLVRAGVIGSFYDDAPPEYIAAFLRACGRNKDARAALAKAGAL